MWSQFEYTLELGGAQPSLIEWDNSVPEFEILMGEMQKADNAASGAANGTTIEIGKKVRATTQ